MSKPAVRQVVLDTETTGLEISEGHRIIEIGCIEITGRQLSDDRRFHHYVCPDRHIDPGALEVHGITAEQLADKPRFADISEELMAFIRGSQLIIHNAQFDVGFLNHELGLFENPWGQIENEVDEVLDTLALARQMHPGMKNSLDALCKRYEIDNSNRTLHGALLDAELLAEVYLAMTRAQSALTLPMPAARQSVSAGELPIAEGSRPPLAVVRASETERAAHERRLQHIQEASDGQCVWLRLGESATATADD